MERPKKQYTLDQCALYKIRGLGTLCAVLGWRGGAANLERLADRPGNYHVWDRKGREIQQAAKELRAIHARIATLLRRVRPSDFRHSGVRKRSFLTNAQQHIGHTPILKADIRQFYPSTVFRMVRKFFRDEMLCADDVAIILAKLCCYRKNLGDPHTGHLPTGGVHSEVLAFYCHRRLFEKLHRRAKARGGNMSVYVDDITLSMPCASLTDLEWTRRLLAKAGLELHSGKSWIYPKRAYKRVTGVGIRNGKMVATGPQHRKAKALDRALRASPDAEKPHAARRLLGVLDHIAHVDDRFRLRAVGTRGRLLSLVNTNARARRPRPYYPGVGHNPIRWPPKSASSRGAG